MERVDESVSPAPVLGLCALPLPALQLDRFLPLDTSLVQLRGEESSRQLWFLLL